MRRVTVLDLGVGNLGNVERALRKVGSDPLVTEDPARVRDARVLVLPGVGAFRPPRERLRGPLEEAVRGALDDGAWLLGICVGYQLLFEESAEHRVTDGLGLLPGRITRLPEGVSIPHIGWNRLRPGDRGRALFAGLDPEPWMYFVHSFAPVEIPESVTLATAAHGVSFAAAAGRGRVMGVQFHPEKSGSAGLRLLSSFLEMTDGSASGD